MSGFEWFLLVVVVIAVPLVVAVAITLWSLEQANLRNRKSREEAPGTEPVKRRATRETDHSGAIVPIAATSNTTHRSELSTDRDSPASESDRSPSFDSPPDAGSTSASRVPSDAGGGEDSGGSGGDGDGG